MSIPKARAELLAHLLNGSPLAPSLEPDLIAWLAARPRFEPFLSLHRDKIRKKLRAAGDEDALLDVRAELLVASLLTADRRLDLAFEAYGSGKRGPDLTATFRANQRFNVEVTRLRPTPSSTDGDSLSRIQSALLAKCRQLPVILPNLIALVSAPDAALNEDTIATAAKHLKQLADRKDEAPFTRRGYDSARDFLAHFTRLSAVLILPDNLTRSNGPDTTNSPALWLNPLARHPLPREIVTALTRAVSDHHAPPPPRPAQSPNPET